MQKQLDLAKDLSELVDSDFQGLHQGGGRSSIKGGQTAANLALEQINIRGYAESRSQVYPVQTRGATALSPYIRHNLLTLEQVWNEVDHFPWKDREKYRDELLWQEYARHLYARIGTKFFNNLKHEQVWDAPGDGWNRDLACIDLVVGELESQGWLVNQTRMWLASHWSVRNQKGWLWGQERMYKHLLDGSRAANLLGWQWTVGAASKPYGFARWQVEKRAPGVCQACPLSTNCPIENFPEDRDIAPAPELELLRHDPNLEKTSGPASPVVRFEPQEVLLTIDSLGDEDPALANHPDLPAVFVFNESALERLQLSSKRIFFYLETLQDLSTRRNLKVFLGDPYKYAQENAVAVTYAPVPSFNKFSNLAAVYPYPWLRQPHDKAIHSYSAWKNKLKR